MNSRVNRHAAIGRCIGHNAELSRLLATRTMKRCSLGLVGLIQACWLLLHAGWATAQPIPQLELPRVTLSAGMHLIHAQVASSPDQRSVGLMYRREMPVNEGMIFVFERPEVQCFWMKNTLLPLTAAFVADDGSIVNLADMKPQSTDSHCSTQPVRYVLEMHQGWFDKRGIKAGSRLSGSLFQTRP
jgi:uncharacterized membrane protein (UPF0127 family)